MNLKQILEKFYETNGFYSRFPIVFGWGIDFAYCGAKVPDEEFSIYLFIATDNHDGTAQIEITEYAGKYLKSKIGNLSAVKQTEYALSYLSL
jgi:hypothetical protein